VRLERDAERGRDGRRRRGRRRRGMNRRITKAAVISFLIGLALHLSAAATLAGWTWKGCK
jgi:hypothetical protein